MTPQIPDLSDHKIVSQAEWEVASRELLAQEKAWTHERERLAEMRRALPWVKVEKIYEFDTPDGKKTLSDLFDGRPQLILQHFMLGPDWEEGCIGCSLMSDSVDGARQHFEHKDLTFVAVSRAPLEKLLAYRKRMGWTFDWVSSEGSDFNFDYHVSFTDEERAANTARWNFDQTGDPETDEIPGVSVFYKDNDGAIYHTYSTYARGEEIFMTAYAYIDMTPLGRNETKKGSLGDWVKHHDKYPNDGRS